MSTDNDPTDLDATDLERRLSELADRGSIGDPSGMLAAARTTAARRTRNRRITAGVMSAAAALVVVLVGVGVLSGSEGDDTRVAVPASEPAVDEDTIAIRLELDGDEIVSGGELGGRVIFDNPTGRVVGLTDGRCGAKLRVALAAAGTEPVVPITLDCGPPLEIQPGQDVLSITVSASASIGVGSLPPFEPGEYEAVLVLTGTVATAGVDEFPVTLPERIPVTVLPAR